MSGAHRPRGLLTVAFGLVVGTLSGCGDGDAADALRRAEPHLSHFARFDRWARRTVEASPALRSRAEIAETLFAPIVLDRAVVDAWVAREDVAPFRASMRGSVLPEENEWVAVRHPSEGRLSVAAVGMPDPSSGDPAHRPAVVVARRARGPQGSVVVVTVAYRSSSNEGPE